MTRDELVAKLKSIGVHESSYSIGQMRKSECVCLVQEGAWWKVYYVERDCPKELAEFADESDANDYVFNKLSEWHGIS